MSSFNRLWLVGAVVGSVVLTSCATNEQGFSAHSVRHERYQISKTKMPGSFADFQQSLFKHRAACGIYFDLSPDPQQVHFATLTYRLDEQDDPKESIYADLTAFTTGNVEIVTYSYYARNAPLARSLINALSSPEQCPPSAID